MLKLGDRVHCSFNDKDGTVTDILTNGDNNVDFPIIILFDDGEEDCYTENGKWSNLEDTLDLTIIS